MNYKLNYKCLMAAAIAATPLLVASPSFAEPPVDLGTAGNYGVLAKSGISNTGATSVVGDIAVSPIGATAITGFGLILDASGEFSTSSVVTGRVFAASYAAPTPSILTTAVSDMETAYTDAAGRPADVTGLGGGNIGGMTLAPGVYQWGTGVTIPTDVTLSGGPTDVWIFQIAGTLTIASATEVILSGGAKANHVFWQVAGQTTLGTTSRFKGIILDQTAIVMNTGASLDGRALAQTAVTLSSNVTTDSGSASQAGLGSALVDDLFFIQESNDPDNNICEVGVTGGCFELFGHVDGVGTGGEDVRIAYNAPRPTDANRSDEKVNVTQRQFSTLDILFDGTSAIGGPLSVKKCKLTGWAKSKKPDGKVSVHCTLDTLLARMTSDQITSAQTAFDGNSKVKFNVTSDGSKGSLAISCSGDASSD